NAGILVAVGAVALAFAARSRRAARPEGPTWGCGYARPTERMQYTGRSFSEMIAGHLLPRFLRPRTARRGPHALFPTKTDFASECPDPFGEKVYERFFRRWAARFTRLRVLQQGKVHVYLLYIVLTVVLALAWVSLRSWWGSS